MTEVARLVRRGILVAGVATVAIGGAAALSSSASAAPPLKATFTAKLTTTVVKPNPDKTISVPAAKLTTSLTSTANGGKLSNGTLPLKSVNTSLPLDLLGQPTPITVDATLSFVQSGKITGAVMVKGNKTSVSATAKDFVKISNVAIPTALGSIPVNVGTNCKTATPVALNLKTANFNLIKGGTLTGTYTLPKFANCNAYGLVPIAGLLSQQLSGPGNKVSVTLTNINLG